VEVTDLPLDQIQEAPWNANQMDQAMRLRLRRSIQRFQLVVPLVVRPIRGPIGDLYETVGGAQRLQVLRELGFASAPCVVAEADDAEARLLSQALNRVQGEDDPGLRAELLRELLKRLPQEEVLKLLPETASGLQALASLGQQDIAGYLQSWRQSQSARLKHLTFQFSPPQLEVIEKALAQVMPQAKDAATDNPNPRGNALYLLCKGYLELTRRNS
jgi:ParB family chromosome partitioning protein